MNSSTGRGLWLVNALVTQVGENILSVQSWSRANYGFYFVSNISECGEISSRHLYEPVSQNKHISVFVGHRAGQEVILAYVALEPNGATGSLGLLYCGTFQMFKHYGSCSGADVCLRQIHIDP